MAFILAANYTVEIEGLDLQNVARTLLYLFLEDLVVSRFLENESING